jgi:hypothetical protein
MRLLGNSGAEPPGQNNSFHRTDPRSGLGHISGRTEIV